MTKVTDISVKQNRLNGTIHIFKPMKSVQEEQAEKELQDKIVKEQLNATEKISK